MGGPISICGNWSPYAIVLCWLHTDFGLLKSANWRRIFVWEGMSSIKILTGDEATLPQNNKRTSI
jgi:hypothetical protein